MLEQGALAGLRIEGQARARYVDLDGEGTGNDRLLLSISGSCATLRDEHLNNQKMD